MAIKNTHVARQSPMFPWSQYNPRGSRKNLAVLNNLSQQFFKCANLSQLIIARGGALTNFSSVQSYSFSHSKRPSNFVSSLVDKSCTTFQIFLDILGHKGKIILVFWYLQILDDKFPKKKILMFFQHDFFLEGQKSSVLSISDEIHRCQWSCIGIKNLITTYSVAKYLKGMESILTWSILWKLISFNILNRSIWRAKVCL